jgi:BNR/Asp-box repeat
MRVRQVAASAALGLTLVAAACTSSAARTAAPTGLTVTVGPVTDVSRSVCAPNNAEVEEATWHQDVYAAWICEPNNPAVIAFARSADGGKTWSTPVVMPGSSGAWDPAVAVAPDGTLYVSFMVGNGVHTYPVVDVSRDQGKTFPQRADLVPPIAGNWGDRDFITAGPHGLVYLTWDYAPTAKYLRTVCAAGGSCSFTAGELNAVIQRSTDYGKTWGPITHVSPGFPASGADAAPLLIGPGGRIDAVYQAFAVANRKNLTLGLGHEYFTSSGDGGKTWSKPVMIGPHTGTESTRAWWIDGAIAADAAGNLYITWDTQARSRDTGWLAYSTNGGKSWSAPVRVTPDNTTAPHIVQSAGGSPGIVYVGWLSDSSPRGYAQYLRVFRVGRGWLDAPVQVSTQFGARSVWPGDTFGIATLPGTAAPTLVLTWGSALSVGSHIYAARVSF